MQDDPHLTIADCRAAGYCVDGARKWFATHGLDFRSFIRNGIHASEVRAAAGDNAILNNVIAAAEARHGR